MESAVQSLPVSQPNHMVYNPHYGQQTQYQTNGYNQYYPNQSQIQLQQMPQQHIPAQPMTAQPMIAQHMPAKHITAQPMPAQEMPIDMTASAVTARPVNDPPPYPVGSTEEPETIAPENEQNSESRPIELEAGSEPNVTVPVEDASAETTMKANVNV